MSVTEGASAIEPNVIPAEDDPAGMQALIDRQRTLEDHMLGLGGARFRRTWERASESKEASTVGAGRKLLRAAIEPMEAGIRALLEQTGKRGPKHLAAKWLAGVDPAAAAFITARLVIDGIQGATPLRTVATDVASTLLDELRYRRLEAKRPALFRYKIQKLPGTNRTHNKRVLDQTIRWATEHSRAGDEELDLSDLVMTEQHRLLVGSKLLDIFAETTGLVRVVSRTVHRKSHARSKRNKLKQELYLEATDETRRWITRRNAVLELLTPVNLPCVLPPLRWGQGRRGGYHFALRSKYDLLRGSVRPEQVARLDATELPTVYAALNGIQETAWRINPRVYALVSEVMESGRALGNLPLSAVAKEALPAKPLDIGENDEARKRWRRSAREVHERNHERVVRALSAAKTLQAAKQVADAERIYFPCSLDFRGRIYPLTHFLSPQGDDLSKALLTFAEGKPLGDDGASWLAVHGANCLDVTPEGEKVKKMTMQERASWIQRNTLRICQVADDPRADLWWTDADEPLQFFAFCVEWRGFYEMFKQGRGNEYACGLPVSQDGTCNGLQHFSAMLRDPLGGRAVNLTPSEQPQDVYQAVTEGVVQLIQDALLNGTDEDRWFAARWMQSGLVKRALCKQPTMTFCYGSKRFGMSEQALGAMQKDRAEGQRLKVLFTDAEGNNQMAAAAHWIAARIWGSLQGTVVAAAQAMAWMQACARILVSTTNQPVEWTVPATGLPVRQEYFVQHFKQIKTVLAGQVIQPTVLATTDEVLTHKQVNAIAPNIVHSLDAAALMMTVVRAMEAGVSSFGMIHDSYATVPADCGALAIATREAFVSLYRDHDVIGHLAACFNAHLPAESERLLPLPPTPGTLDIEGVLTSTYFFS